MPFKKTNPRETQQAVPVKSIFVGRADHLRYFIQNILQPEDPTHNIISISGQGGVGKTTLLYRFLDEARVPDLREYCLTALVNERQTTPASIMERFADQFRELGHPFKKFEEALVHYKEALRRMHATGAGYRDEQELIVREVMDTTGAIMEDLPFAGTVIHKGANTLTDLMLERGYRRQFLKDAARLEDPIGDLTSAFVKDLNQLADAPVSIGGPWNKRPRRLLLFFDTFEQLAPDIAPWLLDHMLEMEISTNIVLIVAGRESIEVSLPGDPKRWLPLLDSGAIHLISLNAFTTEETQSYLEQRGISDPERIKQITQLSHGLPLYLGMLTSNPEGRIDPNAQVVENFLRWIPQHEHARRQLALNASLFTLPFTKDDLAAFSYDEPERSALYTWLISQPFIQSNAQDGRHTYHDLARDLFSRHLYQRSPEDYYTARKALADHYQTRLATLQSDNTSTLYKSHPWQELALALIQQLFLLPNEASHMLAIEYVLTIREHSKHDEELIKSLTSLLSYESNQQIATNARSIVKLLSQYLEEDADDQYRQWFVTTTSLLERIVHFVSFSPKALACLYHKRGSIYFSIKEYQHAITDLSQSLMLNPDYMDAYEERGFTYALMERYREAIADLDRAIALGKKSNRVLAIRGFTYGLTEQYEESLADFDRAITQDEKSALVIAGRGETYRLMKRYEEALADFDRAIDLNEKYVWAIGHRGDVYQQMGKYEKALTDFDHANALDEKDVWVIVNRGETYLLMERYEEALADFDRAINLDGEYDWAIWRRGRVYRAMGRYEEALADFDRAIALDEKSSWAMASRGEIYQLMERYEEALADFDRAITLHEKYTWAIRRRGEVYQEMERYEEALADFDRAIVLDEKDVWAIVSRGQVYQEMERYEEALADFDRAIALDEKSSWAMASRGEIYRLMERYEEALADFDRAIMLDEKYAWAIGRRGEVYQEMGRYEEALADFDRAITLDEKADWVIANRGETYRLMKRYEEALTDFDRAITLDEKADWVIANRGETYRLMERYEEALGDFDRAIMLDEQYDWAIESRGVVYLAMERYDDALIDFDRAIVLDEKNDWIRYERSLVYLFTDQLEAFHQDIHEAIDAARSQLEQLSTEDSEYYRLRFNVAIYLLVGGSIEPAEAEYSYLISSCSMITRLQGAAGDLREFLTVQPGHEPAGRMLKRLEARIEEIECSRR